MRYPLLLRVKEFSKIRLIKERKKLDTSVAFFTARLKEFATAGVAQRRPAIS